MRISNSFSEGEIQLMEFIVQTLLRGGTPSMATRNKDFASLCRKVMAMKAKVVEKQLAAEQQGVTHLPGDLTQSAELPQGQEVPAQPIQAAL